MNDPLVRTNLQQNTRFVTTVLMSYQLEPNYLDLLSDWLTNPESSLKNDSVS